MTHEEVQAIKQRTREEWAKYQQKNKAPARRVQKTNKQDGASND